MMLGEVHLRLCDTIYCCMCLIWIAESCGRVSFVLCGWMVCDVRVSDYVAICQWYIVVLGHKMSSIKPSEQRITRAGKSLRFSLLWVDSITVQPLCVIEWKS